MNELHLLSTGIIALAGVIAYLYRRFERRADKCEEDRAQLWAELRRLSGSTCSRADCKDRIPLPVVTPPETPNKIIVGHA